MAEVQESRRSAAGASRDDELLARLRAGDERAFESLVESCSKLVASRGRLLRPIEAWDDEMRDAYTRMCADRARELALGASPPLGAWVAMVEPAVREGPALLGFVAARIAEEVSGRAGHHAERARQADWLVARLGLEP